MPQLAARFRCACGKRLVFNFATGASGGSGGADVSKPQSLNPRAALTYITLEAQLPIYWVPVLKSLTICNPRTYYMGTWASRVSLNAKAQPVLVSVTVGLLPKPEALNPKPQMVASLFFSIHSPNMVP